MTFFLNLPEKSVTIDDFPKKPRAGTEAVTGFPEPRRKAVAASGLKIFSRAIPEALHVF